MAVSKESGWNDAWKVIAEGIQREGQYKIEDGVLMLKNKSNLICLASRDGEALVKKYEEYLKLGYKYCYYYSEGILNIMVIEKAPQECSS